MRTLHWALALAASMALTPAAVAAESEQADGVQGDPEAGKELVMQGKPDNPQVLACKTCHGKDGKGNAMANFPRLAGQDPAYQVKQLKNFAAGERENYPQMNNIAGGMSEQEMHDVAAYYARKDVSVVGGSDASQDVLAKGERIAKVGVSESNVPACTSCHGPKGKGVPPVFPQIGGQHAGYIEKQLNDWKGGNRANDPAQMMTEIAPKLSDDQIAAAAAYFSNAESGGSD
ncbi:c-type cytochrome [Thiohalorhabdus sp.]|uniref:c-type cytochrome n=1 Tax=Thiohalorhabdus sp. TaxID=3094134 RepID=UPI002FC2E0CF